MPRGVRATNSPQAYSVLVLSDEALVPDFCPGKTWPLVFVSINIKRLKTINIAWKKKKKKEKKKDYFLFLVSFLNTDKSICITYIFNYACFCCSTVYNILCL